MKGLRRNGHEQGMSAPTAVGIVPEQVTRHDYFAKLYDSTYSDLWKYCRRRSRNDADANDHVADVMSTAWRRIDDIPDPPADRLWLFGVARNHLRSGRRREDRRSSLNTKLRHNATFTTLIKTDEAEQLDVVAVALTQLDDDERELIELVAWDELSHREIAELFDISENAVAIRLHRARARLAQIVEKLQ